MKIQKIKRIDFSFGRFNKDIHNEIVDKFNLMIDQYNYIIKRIKIENTDLSFSPEEKEFIKHALMFGYNYL